MGKQEKSSAFAISQEDIDAILTRGSGIHQGKFRIYEQFLKQDSSENNIAFLKNEYGIGGAYPAISGRNLDESHDAKGIKISRGRISRPDAELLLRWNKAERRIGELIRADRYLSQAEKDNYPAYREQAEARRKRGEISEEFRSIVYDYNDFVAQLGEESKALNLYYLSSCWSAFSVGEKKMHARTAEGDFILPMMREAMNTIIADNTHLTARCEAMLEALNSDVAKALEPTFDELNPPPEPRKEYRYHLGDAVYIGTQEYELLSFDEKKVVLFDTQFPLFNKELTREEFDNRLKENPLNDRLLQVVEELPVADNTKADQDVQEPEAVSDEELDALPISTVKDGEVVTYSNAEALLDDQEEALAPPPQVKKPSRIVPHVLHPEINTEYRTNFRIENDDIGVGTPLERFYHNIRAIQLLNKLNAENRLATPTEQRVLADYVGWGGLSEFFKEENPHYSELKNVLSDEEYASARESTLTAFYTPPVVIKAVYSALENMSFQTGNVLEPSCGVGNFMGLVPESMNGAKFYGVELDSVSGRIAQQLYQKNSIAVQGFENTNLPDSFFDAAIGNVPFGQFKVPDKRYDKHNFLIHDYFFARALDKVRPGGVIAFITSKGTMDKENPNVRKYIAQRADLLGAIRLPNDTFKAAAGTEVTSDILFLQKRDRLIDIEPEWVHLATDANGIRLNAYFVDNPEMVLGDMQMVSGPHGMESACIAYENAELGDLLRDAIQNIHAEITELELDDIEAEVEDLSIPADPDVRNFSFTVVDGKIYYRENSRMNPVDVSATAESRIKGMIGIRDCVRTLIEYQTEDYPDADIKAEQEKLNRLYDDFSKKYGLISARANNSAFNSDSSYCLLASLEVLDDEGNFLRKADMFSKRTIKQKVTVQSVDTASEAYALSIAEKARIDMPYMSQLTGKTEQELFEDLKGVIFLNPMHISEEDGKVRSGQVRVLIGSTQKMGAGTNVQTKLAALHHLDCPWRPSDLQQREGRIIRQGNENKEVDIYTYVTENTFDSYLYQLVESKQKFIGQIMTSKSPVRSAEDIDETALSYAEIKALCAGDPHIKEKMDLDIDVSRLKLLKANHLSQRYSLEDQILKEFPQKIKSLEQRIEGYRADIDQRKRNTEPNEDGFSPMFMPGGTVREKKAAGDAILGLCKSMTSPDPIPIGQYRGFDMELSFDTFSREYKITLIHQLRHTVTLGTDTFGNIQRLDNTLGAFEERMAACVEQLENTRVQLENAKAEVQKPFPQEEELKTKSARLNELNAMLNLDKRENEIVDGERADEEPSRSSDDRER